MSYINESGLAEFTSKMKAYIDRKFAEYFLTFSSPDSFTLSIVDNTKYWDGTLETSTNKTNWTTWDGTSAVSSAIDGTKHNIYVRGTGNTYITGSSAGNTTCCWRLNGSDISISGNIENLLDYATVELGNHPAMANHCFRSLFRYPDSSPNTSIVNVEDLELPATTLTEYCYDNMFRNNTGLIKSVKELPATTVPQYAYRTMFGTCSSLVTTPIIRAEILTGGYNMTYMFQNCTLLTTAPSLLATTLAQYCYSNMFRGCTSLTTAPSLPATTLADYCYNTMFYGCTSLTTLPKLEALSINTGAYQYMFSGCSNIKLSRYQTGIYVNEYRIPYGTGTGTWYGNAVYSMFYGTGGTWTGEPTINTTYYTPNEVV